MRVGRLELKPTALMGVVNVTPDSFSDGGRYLDPQAAVARGLKLVRQGASLLDVGGESTRPGAATISVGQEQKRVLPVIEGLLREMNNDPLLTAIPISIDTCKPEVARVAVAAGASMVNDVCGLRDQIMRETVAELGVPVVMMHMLGDPRTMQSAMNPATAYQDVVLEVRNWLGQRVEKAQEAGIGKEMLIVDPGIGFGKTVDQNLQLIARLEVFRELGCPLLVGPSNKSFIGAVLDLPVEERLEGTLAAVAACALQGVEVVRVHEVAPALRVARLATAIRAAANGSRAQGQI